MLVDMILKLCLGMSCHTDDGTKIIVLTLPRTTYVTADNTIEINSSYPVTYWKNLSSHVRFLYCVISH